MHAGAELPPAKQAELKAINKRLSTLQTEFSQKLLAAAKAGALHVDRSRRRLPACRDEQIAAAKQAAKDRKLDGYVVPLQNTTQQPSLDSLTSHATRQQLLDASLNRAEHGDANDTRNDRSARSRSCARRKRRCSAAANFADYNLYDQMAKDRATAVGFLDRLAPAVRGQGAAGMGRTSSRSPSRRARISSRPPADWNFYAEQIRKQRYAIDSDQLKQYFEFNKVLDDGVFYAANQLYGLTFKERKDIPTWSPDMRVFQVYDQDGKELAIFMIDPWKRDNKNGRRVDVEPRQPVVPARHQAGRLQRRELHQARAWPAGADQLGRRDDDVPRVRPRAARHVRGADLSDACRARTSRATSSSSPRSSTRTGRSIRRCFRTTR